MDMTLHNVARANVEFALAYLDMERIPVVASDVGGRSGRKVLYFTDAFDVYVRRVGNERIKSAVQEEKQCLLRARRQRCEKPDIILFTREGDR